MANARFTETHSQKGYVGQKAKNIVVLWQHFIINSFQHDKQE